MLEVVDAGAMSRLDEVLARLFDERCIGMWQSYLALREASIVTGISQESQIDFEKRQGIA